MDGPAAPWRALLAGAGLAVVLLATAAVLGLPQPQPRGPLPVTVEVERCGRPDDIASGTLLDRGRVLTVAHVLDDVGTATVLIRGMRLPVLAATALDRADLALLRLDDAGLPRIADPVLRGSRAGDRGMYRGAGADGEGAFEIVRRVRLTLRPVAAGSTGVRRQAAEIAAEVRRGDSGAALLVEHELAGVIFARSTRDAGRAWATDAVEAEALLDPTLASDERREVVLAGC